MTLTERGAPHSLALMESGKLLPGVNVIIANPGRMRKREKSFGFSPFEFHSQIQIFTHPLICLPATRYAGEHNTNLEESFWSMWTGRRDGCVGNLSKKLLDFPRMLEA